MGKRVLVADAVALAVFAAASLPSLTGVAAHEWIGVVLAVGLAVHLAMRLDRVVGALGGGSRRRGEGSAGSASQSRAAEGGGGRGVRRGGAGRALRIALDALLAVALVACAVSGVLMSGAVLPALGLYAEGYYFWDPLHAASAKLLLALLIVHLAANARAVAGLLGKGKGEAIHE